MGSWMLGRPNALPLGEVFNAFSGVSLELWLNARAIFTDDLVQWTRLDWFFDRVFLPYLIGGIVPGVIAGVTAYILSRPLIAAYQKARIKRLKTRFAKRREIAEKAIVARRKETNI